MILTDWIELPAETPNVIGYGEAPKRDREDHFVLVPLTGEDLDFLDAALDEFLDDVLAGSQRAKLLFLQDCLQSWAQYFED